jgi:hypothetical protein
MAQTTSEVWDTRWSSTRRTVRPEVVDNFFEAYNTVKEFRKGGIQMVDTGGKEIQCFLQSSGTDVESFSRGDTLGKNQADPVESAFYKRRYYAAPVVMWLTDDLENQGPAQQFDYLKALGDNAAKSVIKRINEDMHSAQSGKNILGFQDHMADAAGVTVGGISSATSTFWESQRYTTAKTFLTQTNTNVFDGYIAINSLVDNCRKQGGTRFKHFTTWSIASAYRASVSSQGVAETSLSDAKGVGGSQNPLWYGDPVIPDNDVPALHWYAAESSAIKLAVIRGANFVKTKFSPMQSNGQLGEISYQIAGVQVTNNNRRVSGVVTALTGI